MHSEQCCYKDTDKLIYAFMQITNEEKVIVSATEMNFFEKYLDLAKNKDKGVRVDMDTCDNPGHKHLVYGGMMFDSNKRSLEKLEDHIKQNSGCAMIELLEDETSLIASSYNDIILYPEKSKSPNFIPFAALMDTDCKLDSEDYSITLFPYTGGLIWEDMVNRSFLLACRKFIPCDDSISLDNWKSLIDMEELISVYAVADLYTGEE